MKEVPHIEFLIDRSNKCSYCKNIGVILIKFDYNKFYKSLCFCSGCAGELQETLVKAKKALLLD